MACHGTVKPRPEATPIGQCKKVRSEGCFAAHFLSVSCAGFGQVVRRGGSGEGGGV